MNKPKLTFEVLTIETTRRCNMKCAHCLRGDAQDVDINYQHIDDLLDQTEVIGHLEITGGEPTLNLDALEYILNGLCKRGIPLFEFALFTNGLMYSERFISLIKWCKEIIDISCSNCFKNGNEYNPKRDLSRCQIGVSLDQFHEKHDICMEHYQQYKVALADYADVRMIIHGNNPRRYGRARQLDISMLNLNSIFDLSKKRRIELLSKDYSPTCPNYYVYHMFHENQKIVCCQIYMNTFGMISSEYGGGWEYENCDAYPKICAASNSIWDSLIEYNKGKIPCALFQKLQTEKMKEVFQESSLEELIKILDRPNSEDEPMHYQKMVDAQNQKRFYELEHPKTIIEAINNLVKESKNYIEAQKLLQKAKEHEAKDFRQIAAEAATHSYFDGDKRGNIEPKTQAKAAKHPAAMKSTDGIRCGYCAKVIQTAEGRNIHCAETEQGLVCGYCKNLNIV